MIVNDSHLTERRGIAEVQQRVSSQLRWLFREQPTSDFGIDAHIEIVTDHAATGRLLAVQVKSGESYFGESSDKGYVYRGSNEHLDYWLNHSLPVIVILFNPTTGECLWQHITEETIERTEQAWKTLILRKNVFDEDSKEALDRASWGTPYELKVRQLQIDKPWMRALQAGDRLFIRVYEWINKSSGRGDFILLRSTQGKEEAVATWPFQIFPGATYKELLPKLFPWAKLKIDKDFYRSYDEDQYEIDCGVYSSGLGEYIDFTQSYDEWKEENIPKGIRPYYDDNEVHHWRLELKLNKVGKSFLRLENYLLDS